MTQYEFTAFYPQFSGFAPAVVLADAVAMANARFTDWAEPDAEHARRLYAAHLLTMYALTVPSSSSPSMAEIADAGTARSRQQMTSKKVGEVQVSYSAGSALAAGSSSAFADLAQTAFGLELLSLLRLYSRPRYIP